MDKKVIYLFIYVLYILNWYKKPHEEELRKV